MQTTRQPYELLIRWSPDGALSGAHIQWRYIITDDSGMALGETLSPVMPLMQGVAEGFPAERIIKNLSDFGCDQDIS